MSPSHTPGPWRVINAAPRADHTTSYLLSGHEWDNAQANARLIAAAPDLLAALDSILSVSDHDGYGARTDAQIPMLRAALAQARAAIAKAKGAQP